MGMFDTVVCRYPLPLSKSVDREFQTKSLENCLSAYEIREDGTLWRLNRFFEEDGSCGPDAHQYMDACTIYFYNFSDSGMVDFKAQFVDGKLHGKIEQLCMHCQQIKCDCDERTECDKVGKDGHRQCGRCDEHGWPRATCNLDHNV
jgi:hypothetical protein